jgi:hypothetical protein
MRTQSPDTPAEIEQRLVEEYRRMSPGQRLMMAMELEAAAGHRHVAASFFAMVHTGLGERDEAFAWLDKAVAERDGLLAHLGVDQTFDLLRGGARFDALLRRIGLVAPGGAAVPPG